jgi:drug/metabolite transporter (DMT)-like permease
MAIANVAFFALYFTWSKQGREHIDTIPFLFGAVVTAAVVVSGYVVVSGEPVGSIGRSDLLIATSIAVVPGTLGHFVSTWPLRWVAANLPPLIQLSVPFLAGTMAYVFLDEPVELLQIAGGVLTLVGVIGALRSTGGRQLAAGT